jgi:hypothetical protein
MSNVNMAFLYFASLGPGRFVDNRAPGPASNQTTATPLLSPTTRVTVATVANGSFVLPSIGGGGVGVWADRVLVNDSGQPVIVYCAVGENLNGTANGSLTIPAGQTGYFMPVLPNVVPGALDWRSVAMS